MRPRSGFPQVFPPLHLAMNASRSISDSLLFAARSVVCVAVLGLGAWCSAQESGLSKSSNPASAASDAAGVPDLVSNLHQRIDALLVSDLDSLIADREVDGPLLRRLSLDLRNVVPTREELDAFQADTRPDRWTHWIARLQSDPLAAERLVDWYDKTLMQRRPFLHTQRAAWIAMLRSAVDENRPLDQMVRDLVVSVWWNPSQRAQQRFFLDRGGDPHAIARDLGRVVFGRDMQCAQCHDHPQIDDYLQIDYHGLLAFVSPSALVEGTGKDDKGDDIKLQMYIERAANDAPFESVFDKGVMFRTATRLPGELERIEDHLAPDQRYQPQPLPDAIAGVGMPPVMSRRGLLAEHLNGAQRAFAENWANRLWAMMFGRGIIHPLDMHHSDNPPSNPELLAAITDALIASRFDVPRILNQIAASDTYQRGRRVALDGLVDGNSVLSLSAETRSATTNQLAAILATKRQTHQEASQERDRLSEVVQQARDAWRTAQQARVATRAQLEQSEAGLNEAIKKVAEGQAALDKGTAAEQASIAKVSLLDEAASKLEGAKSGPEDSELQSAIAIAKTRADQLRTALPSLRDATVAATVQRDTLIMLREAERTKWQGVVDLLAPLEKSLTEADQTFVDARATYEQCNARTNAYAQRIQELEKLERWLTLSDQAIEARNNETSLAQRAVEIKQQLESLEANRAEAEQRVKIAEQTLATHLETVRAASVIVQAYERQTQQFDVAMSGLIAVAPLLIDPKQLDQAVEEIQRSRDVFASQRTDASSKLTALQQQQAALEMSVHMAVVDSQAAAEQWTLGKKQQAEIEVQLTQAPNRTQELFKQCNAIRISVGIDLQNRNAIAAERPLSPEQLGWSILRSTGVLNNYIINEKAELDKQGPLAADADQVQIASRERIAMRSAMDKLLGNVDVFSNLYASGVGQTSDEFFASPDQALYVANGGAVYAWAGPNGSNVANSVMQQPDLVAAADLMYWSLLSRPADPQEIDFVVGQLSNAGEQKPAIVQELVWSILAGVEYRLYP